MADSQDLGWGPGWPHCQTNKIATLVRSDGFRQPLRKEIIPLVAWLMDETEKRGYDIRPDWSWGYNCRAIRGYPNTPSNHSWGLALDINAPANPMLHGQPGWAALHKARRTDMPEWMPPLWKAHGFRWGGDYAHRQDAMHYEVVVSPADIARITRSIGGGHPNPGDPPPTRPPYKLTRTLHEGNRGEDVREAQNLLIWCSTRYKDTSMFPGLADGEFGGKTAHAVLGFKTAVWGVEEMGHRKHTFNKPFSATVGRITFGSLQYWASMK